MCRVQMDKQKTTWFNWLTIRIYIRASDQLRLKRNIICCLCGYFQIKHIELSYRASTLCADWQSFNTRNIERTPVCRSDVLAYDVAAAPWFISRMCELLKLHCLLMCPFVVTPPEETYSAVHHQPPPGRYFKYLHRIQKYPVCFFLRAQRVVIQPVMNNCRFRITTMCREHRPEKARYSEYL